MRSSVAASSARTAPSIWQHAYEHPCGEEKPELEVSEREVRRQVRGVEREFSVISTVHHRRRYRPRAALKVPA